MNHRTSLIINLKDVTVDGTARALSTEVNFSDVRLQELSAEPREDLFPAMKSAPAVAPWLIVFSFLPVVCGFLVWTLTDHSAHWALRALQVSQTGQSGNTVIGTQTLTSGPLTGAPPLATWLTAWLMMALGTESRVGLLSISCLAVAGTVFFAAKLARRFGGPRLAWLTAVCCAGHPLLLNCTETCSPEALGLCLMTLSLERFLAHLDGAVGQWSGRLLAAGLAWGGCWLAIGWPALTLGIALTIHASLSSAASLDGTPAELSARQKFRHSLAVWWVIGLLTGGWWLCGAIQELGFLSTFGWLLDPAANPISPLFPYERRIVRWGATVGFTFLLGWVTLGIMTMLRNRKAVLADQVDGRALALLLWWVVLLLCRVMAVHWGADPTMWDVLQIVPGCLAAACGMEVVLQRTVRTEWLICGILLGVLSLSIHLPRLNTPAVHWAVFLGALFCLMPLVWNLLQSRSLRWTEAQIRLALSGLMMSSWVAHLSWGVAQAFSGSSAEVRLAEQLAKVKSVSPAPAAIVVVTDASPSASLEFQLRRRWPAVPMLVADRWESAVSHSLPSVENWSDAEFLVVEVTRRDSQFRRPGAGWIVTQAGEPRRYRGDKLTMHRVSIQSP